MKFLWIVVIAICVVVLLVLLYLLTYCCRSNRNEQNNNIEREQASTRLFQRERQFEGPSQFNVESEYRSWNKPQTSSLDNQFQSPLKYSYPTRLPVESQNHRHPRNESRTIPKQVFQAGNQTKKSLRKLVKKW